MAVKVNIILRTVLLVHLFVPGIIIVTAEDRPYYSVLTEKVQFNEGKWGDREFCDEGKFVRGYKLFYQPYQGKQGVGRVFASIFSLGIAHAVSSLKHEFDDHCVVGVRLYCSGSKTNSDNSLQELNSYLTKSGEVHQEESTPRMFCDKGFAIGFRLKEEKPQGTPDDFGVTNVQLICQNGQTLLPNIEFSPGEWIGPPRGQRCERGKAVCGLQIRVETDHHDDNIGLSDVKMFCCDLPDASMEEAETCKLETAWHLAVKHTNRGETPEIYRYAVKVGMARLNGDRTVQKQGETNGNEYTVGTEVEAQFGNEASFTKAKLKGRFEYKSSNLETKESEKEHLTSEAFSKEHEVEHKAVVGPKQKIEIWQRQATCGSFEMKTMETETKQECLKGYEELCQQYVQRQNLALPQLS